MTESLAFQNVQFEIIDRNGEPWVRSPQIGDALGFVKGRVSIAKLYEAHADEFTPSMTALVKLPTEGGEQEVRIFSLRGCHLLAMFARTPVAKEFRKWVLDVLDNLHSKQPAIEPEPETDALPALGQMIIQALVRNISHGYQPHAQRGINTRVWNGLRSHFGIASYKQLPPEKLIDAVIWLANYNPQQKRIEDSKPEASQPEQPTQAQQTQDVSDMGKFMNKNQQQILGEVYYMSQNCGKLIDQLCGNMKNGVLHYASDEQKRYLFYALKHMRDTAVDALYMAQNSLMVAWNLGSGVKFV